MYFILIIYLLTYTGCYSKAQKNAFESFCLNTVLKNKRKINIFTIYSKISVCVTFKVHSDDVIISNQIATRQQFRHFLAMGPNDVTYTIASDAVGA